MEQGNIVFFNGALRPEREVGIPIRDRGYIYGDAVFDATRTFNGKPFRLRDHIRRLYNSLRYLRIDPGMDPEEMERWSIAVVNHNYPLLPINQDVWIFQRISRGVEAVTPEEETGPTVLIETHPIPFARRAALYRDGISVITPSIPRIPPRFMSPRAKTHNYLNLVLGDLEAQANRPGFLGDSPGRKREPHRGQGLQHILGQRWGGRHTPSPVCTGGYNPGHSLRPGSRPGPFRGGNGLGPLRCLHCRRGVSHFHQPLRLPSLVGQWRCYRTRPSAGRHYPAVDRVIQRLSRDGLRGPIPFPSTWKQLVPDQAAHNLQQ